MMKWIMVGLEYFSNLLNIGAKIQSGTTNAHF